MKNKIIVFIVFLIFNFLMFYIIIPKNYVIDEPASTIIDNKVIKYINVSVEDLVSKPNDFNAFYLLFDTYHLTTKNMEYLFSFFNAYNYEYTLGEVYPYLNPLYKNNLNNIEEIMFNGSNLVNGINNLYNIYINELEKYNLDKEINKVFVNGIKIRLIKIYTSNEAMYKFLVQNSDIKYSLNKEGIYQVFSFE